MKTTARILASIVAAAATPLNAASPAQPGKGPAPVDDRRMSTVYVLAQAGAILDLCLASPDAARFPDAKSKEIQDLAARLGGIVRTIGTHYRDAELLGVYESTKANMAADTKLRFHVKNNHQNCGERTMGEMRAYVAENEALIGRFVERKRLEESRQPGAARGPIGK
jgi:hypothetical protein